MDRVWVLTDKYGLRQTAALGLQRAESGDWSSGSANQRLRAYHGWLLERCRLMAGFWGDITVKPDQTEIYINPGKMANVSEERAMAAIVLYRTLVILQNEDLRNGDPINTDIVITEGDIGLPLPLIAAAAIVSLAQVVAVAYCIDRGAVILDRELNRREDLKKLVQRDKAVLDLAAQHQAAEEKAGKPLPMNPVTKDALKSLLEQQEAIVKKVETPLQAQLPSVPNPTVAIGGFSIGAIAGILGVMAFLVWNK